MKCKFELLSLLLLLTFSTQIFSQSDKNAVQSEFDRCVSVMERAERSLRKGDDALKLLRRSFEKVPAEKRDVISQEISTLENRLEHFRNRLERSRSQSDKLRTDLKNSGPTCPSCTESGVKLFCRNGESLQNELDDYQMKLSDLQTKIGLNNITNNEPASDENNFEHHRMIISDLIKITQDKLKTCTDKAAITLFKQSEVNLNRADSLYNAHDNTSALKSLNIAHTLLEKVSTRCKGE